MAGDEARVFDCRERALRRRDVRHDGVRAGRGEHVGDDGWCDADRDRDDDELRVGDGLGEGSGRGKGADLRCLFE